MIFIPILFMIFILFSMYICISFSRCVLPQTNIYDSIKIQITCPNTQCIRYEIKGERCREKWSGFDCGCQQWYGKLNNSHEESKIMKLTCTIKMHLILKYWIFATLCCNLIVRGNFDVHNEGVGLLVILFILM